RHRRLGGCVGTFAARRADARDRRRVDDPPAARCDEVGRSGPNAVPHAEKVDVDDPPEFVGLVLVQAGHAADARVVEDGVQPAELGGRGIDSATYGIGITYIDGERAPADLGGDGGRTIAIEVEYRHTSSLGREAAAGGTTDAGAATRDHC